MPDLARRKLRSAVRLPWLLHLATLAALAPATCAAAGAEPQTLLLNEGTGISVSATGAGEIFTDLAGRLWRINRENGTATPLTADGEVAQRPAVAPDGRSVAYQSLRNGFYQIVQISSAGESPRQLTSGDYHHVAPAWAPDGRKLLVAANRTGDYSLWELDLELLTLNQVTFEPGDELDPAWEPGGNSIAYVADDGKRSGLYLRELLKPARPLVVTGKQLRAPAWRPDGSVITFVAQGRDGSRLNMVILSDPPVVKELSRVEDAFPFPAAWVSRETFLYTADGRIRQREFGALAPTEVRFTAAIRLTPAPALPQRATLPTQPRQSVRGVRGVAVLPGGHLIVAALGNLWEIGAGGELVRQLTSDPFADADPAASADGRQLAFVSDRAGTQQIWLMNLAEGETRQVSREPLAASRPAWNASGERIAYLAGRPDDSAMVDLKVVDATTGATQVLAEALSSAAAPAWTNDGSGVAVLQGARLTIHAADGSDRARHLTLLNEAVGPGESDVQWAADGRAVAVASSAGVTVLPILEGGVVGAEWRRLSDGPATLVRWTDGGASLVFYGPEGLNRVSVDDGKPAPLPLSLTVPEVSAAGRLVVRAGRVFTGLEDGYAYAQDIVIEGNRIVELRPWTTTLEPGARLLDARGKAVIPGLIDPALRLDAPVRERVGRSLLAYGITTVQAEERNPGDLREVAERWQAYGTGPRLFMQPVWCRNSGPITPEMAQATGINVCEAVLLDRSSTIVDAVRAARLAVWTDGWLALTRGAADAVAPGGWSPPLTLYQDAIDVVVRSGAVLVPGLAVRGLPALTVSGARTWLEHRQYLALFSRAERDQLERTWQARAGSSRTQLLRDQQRTIGRIVAGGGRLAAASRSPVTPYGLGLHAELALLAQAGLSPAQILRIATVGAGRLLGLESEVGTIAAGRLADLVVVDGDPLADVTQVLRLETVIVNGRARALEELLAGGESLEKFTPSHGTAAHKTSP